MPTNDDVSITIYPEVYQCFFQLATVSAIGHNNVEFLWNSGRFVSSYRN